MRSSATNARFAGLVPETSAIEYLSAANFEQGSSRVTQKENERGAEQLTVQPLDLPKITERRTNKLPFFTLKIEGKLYSNGPGEVTASIVNSLGSAEQRALTEINHISFFGLEPREQAAKLDFCLNSLPDLGGDQSPEANQRIAVQNELNLLKKLTSDPAYAALDSSVRLAWWEFRADLIGELAYNPEITTFINTNQNGVSLRGVSPNLAYGLSALGGVADNRYGFLCQKNAEGKSLLQIMGQALGNSSSGQRMLIALTIVDLLEDLRDQLRASYQGRYGHCPSAGLQHIFVTECPAEYGQTVLDLVTSGVTELGPNRTKVFLPKNALSAENLMWRSLGATAFQSSIIGWGHYQQ